MPATKESLGIELQLSLDGKFSELIKQIEAAFSKIDLKGFEGKVSGLEGKIAGVTTKVGALATKISELTGRDSAKVKLEIDTSKLNSSITSTEKSINNLKNIIFDANGKMMVSFSDYGKSVLAIERNTNSVMLAERKRAIQQLAAIKEDTNRQSQPARDLLAGLSKQGLKYYNGDVIPRSYVTNIDKAQTEAIKVNNAADIASYKNRGAEILAIERNTNASMLAERKVVLAQLSALKEDRTRQANSMSDFMSGLSNQGLKYANGDIVPKTYITDVARAQSEALKYNETLKSNTAQLKEGEAYLASLAKQGKAHWNGQEVSVQQYTKNLKAMNGEVSESVNKFGIFNMSIGNMAKRLAEFYLIRGVFFTIRNQITTSVSELIKFNQALADTAAISNASEEGVKKFGLAAQMIARTSKMDLKEVMQLMNLLAQSGVSEKDVPLVSRVTAMFATGTGSSAENAVRVMTTALNVWNIEASKSSIVADTLTAGLNSAKLEVNELSTVFNYLAPMARQAGYSIQETTAIIATMSQMGVKASTIGTGTGQLLTRLMAPTKGVKDLAKAYNLELDELNPRLHKFSEIIKTLQTADGGRAIPVQDLLKGFGQIAGRSVSAAVTAGAEYFKEMERNISLGNASLVAYSKTLEGAGAKLNILRQTFVQLVGSLSSFNGVLGFGYELMLNFVRGLMSSEGKILAVGLALTGLSTAVYVFRASLMTFLASNPLTIAFAAIGLVIGSLIDRFGSLSTETTKLSREHDKLAKDMGATQRAFQEISEIYGKASQAGELNNTITKEHREQLIKLVNTTPSLHGVIDTSVTKYGQLSGTLKGVNDQMERLSKNNLNAYNSIVDRLNKAKDTRGMLGLSQSYNERESDIYTEQARKVATIDSSNISQAEKEVARTKLAEWVKDEIAKAQDKFRSNANNAKLLEMLDTKRTMANGTAVDPTKDDPYNLSFSKFREADPYVMPKSNTNPYPTPGIGERGNGGQLKAKDMAEAARLYANEASKAIDQMTVQELETNLKTALEDIKGETDQQAYDEKKKAIEWYIKRLEKESLAAFIEEQHIKVAGRVGAEYDPTKEKPYQFPNTDQGKLDFAAYDEYTKANPTAFVDHMKALLEEKGLVTAAGTNLKTIKVPERTGESLDKPYNSISAEKQADRELTIKLKELAIRKDLAVSAEEVRNIEVATVEASIKNSDEKEKAFTREKESLETWLYAASETDSHYQTNLDRLSEIQDKLVGINDLTDEQNRKLKDIGNTDFGYNFGRGSTKALIAQGDFKSNTEQLGLDVANTGLNGMINLIDQSITKLEKLEWSWKSFRDTLGSVIKDIASELQKYIIKMLVVAAVQKIIGLFASSSFGSAAELGTGSTNSLANGSAGSMPTFHLAEGGPIPLNMGVPGQDSVPILGMPGEFMVKTAAVEKYGVDFMHELNAGRVKMMAEGGPVRATAGGSGNASQNNVGTIQIVNLVDPSSIPQTTDAQIINVINFDIARKGPTFKSVKLVAAQN